MSEILSGLAGLCAGIVSGSALCAFYIALGVFSKSLISFGLNKAKKEITVSNAVGVIFGTIITIFNVNIEVSVLWAALFGLFGGIFVGIFVACLVDIVNTIPVVKTLGIPNNYIVFVFFAIVFGKFSGSLIYWISGVF